MMAECENILSGEELEDLAVSSFSSDDMVSELWSVLVILSSPATKGKIVGFRPFLKPSGDIALS